MGRKMLIVVDMQNDFVDGALANPAAKAIVPLIKNRLELADKNNEVVAFTYDTHFKNYSETLEGKLLPVPHCIKDTEGWQIVPELKPWADKYVTVIKKTFGFSEWEELFRSMFDENTFPEDFPEEIELCGTCTDICVVSNALILRALYPNLKITVNGKLCAGSTIEKHNMALQIMESCQINMA